MNKPIIRYPTLISYIKSFSYNFNKNILYPCLKCRGNGKIVDPEYVPEYESHTEYIKCKECKGTGEGSFHEVNEAWEKQLNKDKLDIKEYQRRLSVWVKLKKKLSKEELKIIKEFGE